MLNRIVTRIMLLVFMLSISSMVKSQGFDTVVVNFGFNKSNITVSAKSTIDNYLLSIRENYIIQDVALLGYTDNIGANVYNESLSLKRVSSVKKYLVGKWLKSHMIISEQGFGKQFPLNDNSTAAFRSMNRRVEIIFHKAKIILPANNQKLIPDEKNNDSLFSSIMDSSTKVGSKIKLKNLIFYGGRHIPLPESYPILNELLHTMKTNLKLEIEIEGHICCESTGQDGLDTDTKSMDLSVQRAKFIFDFLIKNGIDKDRMSYSGFGSSHKLYPEERNLMEQSLNRRVEIKIVNK